MSTTGNTQGEDRVALLEERIHELEGRVGGMEAWSDALYRYERATNPRGLAPPLPYFHLREAYRAAAIAPAPVPPGVQPERAMAPPAVAGPPFVTQPNAGGLLRRPIPTLPAVPFVPGAVFPQPGMIAPTSEAAPAAMVAPRPAASRRWSFNAFEQLVSGRGLAWIGGLAILLGTIFFLSLAFTRGWIGPAGRVAIGMVAGVVLIGGGAWFFERRTALFGHVLVAVGLSTMMTALVASTRLYHLFPTGYALAAALIVAVAAAVIAIRADSQVVAAYGLVAALAAPPLLGASPNMTTVAFLGAALVGTTTIALYRTWRWLPPIAFLFSAPQLGDWLVTGAPLAIGLASLAAFWLLNTLASGGEEFRVRRDRLSGSSAGLLLASAAFLLFVGFAFLDRQDATDWHGCYLLVLACAYGAVGAYFLRAEGMVHPFGLLATGTGIAALTMAIPIQFGGPVVPIAWAAEGTALAWVYARRQHRFSGIAALTLGILAVLHIVTREYPPFHLLGTSARVYGTVPFIDAEGMALAFVLLAFGATACLVRLRMVRAPLTFVGFMLVAYAMPFEAGGLVLLTGWATLLVLVFASERGTPLIERRYPWLAATAGSEDLGRWLRGVCAGMIGILALGLTYSWQIFGTTSASGHSLPAVPFVDRRTVATLILIAASLLIALLATARLARRCAIIAPFAFAAILLPTEVRAAAVVVGWSALAIGLAAIARRDSAGRVSYFCAAGALLAIGFVTALTFVAPPTRLAVHGSSAINHPLFFSGASAALGAVMVAVAFIGWQYRNARVAAWLGAMAGAIAVYIVSVGIVDEFQRHVTAGTTAETLANLRKQAQVALSICWAMLGGAAFVAGIIWRHAGVRIGGLALLGVATVKVFLFDLASLDATYRVPSLIGLGILLLASSYVYQRLRPRDDRRDHAISLQ